MDHSLFIPCIPRTPLPLSANGRRQGELIISVSGVELREAEIELQKLHHAALCHNGKAPPPPPADSKEI
jgi:hypothetical protein